jgi:GTPase SAR1 family protein
MHTAGQEKFHSLVPLYFRKAAAVLVVYDITRQKTYEDAKAWVKELKTQAPENVIIALAGNKLDLANLRDIETEEARQYANEIGAIFMETSAKDSTGIAKIFEEIGITYLNRIDGRKRRMDTNQIISSESSTSIGNDAVVREHNSTKKQCCLQQ